MEPAQHSIHTAADLSVERVGLENEHNRIQEIDKRINELSQSLQLLHRSITELKQTGHDSQAQIYVVRQLKERHPFLSEIMVQGDISTVLEKAVLDVQTEIEHLHQQANKRIEHQGEIESRGAVAARKVPDQEVESIDQEDIWSMVTDHADPATKAVLSQISRAGRDKTISSVKRECDFFVQRRIEDFVEALLNDELVTPKVLRDQIIEDLQGIRRNSFDDVATFSEIKSKIFDLRNRVVEALSKLDPKDFQSLPTIPEPPSFLPQDLKYSAFSLIQEFLKMYSGPEFDSNKEPLLFQIIEQGDFDTALKLIDQMEDVSTKNKHFNHIVSKLVAGGNLKKALEIAEKIVLPRFSRESFAAEEPFIAIASRMAASGDVDGVWEILKKIDTYRDYAFDRISTVLAAKGQLEDAIRFSGQIIDLGKRERVFSYIASEFASIGNIRRALEIARSIQGEQSRSEAYKAIVSKLAALENFDEALEVARLVTDNSYYNQRFQPILSAMIKAGQSERALQIVDTHFHDSYREGVLESVIEEMAKHGQFEQAIQLADDTMSLPLSKAEAFSSIAIELAKAGQFERALSIAQERITLDNIQSRCFGSIALEMVSKGKLKEALEVVEKIKDEQLKKETLKNISQTLLKMKKFDEAFDVASKIGNNLIESQIYSDILLGFAMEGDILKAHEVSGFIMDSTVKMQTMKTMMYILGKTLEQAELNKNAVVLSGFASKLARLGNFDDALSTIGKISDDEELKFQTLGFIALAMAKAGNFEKAIEVVEQITDPETRKKVSADIKDLQKE